MFDSLMEDVAGRTGLSADKARQLLGALTALIFDEKQGGFAGFIDRFRQKGLGELVQSWVGTGPNQPITPAQVQDVFGAPLIGGIASRLGLDSAATASAIGGALPGLVDRLSADGQVPAGLPDTLKGWVASAGDWLGDLGSHGWGALAGGAAAVGGAVAGGARAAGHSAGAGARAVADAARQTGRGTGRLLPWLLLAAAIIVAFLLLRGCHRPAEPAGSASSATESAAPAPPAPTPAATAGAPAPGTAPASTAHAALDFGKDKLAVSGELGSDAERTRLMDALRKAYGASAVDGDLKVAAGLAPAPWLDKLVAALPSLRIPGLSLGLEGNRVDIKSGGLPEAERFAASQAVRDAFDGFDITGQWDRASAALGALTPQSSPEDLAKALNLLTIGFATGSATITADSAETLERAATAIATMPAGTRIEVGGHTDNTGNAAANLKLSQDRADAVQRKLVELGAPADRLAAKGYGQDAPVADNATEEGRAQNRRMIFTVLK
ncbi:OmpA family protein [[Pseudomonas] boreopolis]|uniref:OmpA family protein n=1 Tax=Xanthomonas boreopolis TaxID=86183 RepID=UPI003D9B6B67